VLLVGHQLRGAAEFAALRLTRGVEDRYRLAALAFDVAFLDLPAALGVAQAPQRAHEIVLDDLSAVGVELGRRDRAAERADQRLPCGVPHRLRAAGRTGKLLLRYRFACFHFSQR